MTRPRRERGVLARQEVVFLGEGLTAVEVGKEIGEHAAHAGHGAHGGEAHISGHDRALSIAEAVVLSVVAIVAAWSGFSAAKWGTESSLALAKASAARAQANRAFQEALTFRVGDSTSFNAWFAAYIAGKKHEADVAARRFRPEYRVAWEAWMATHPFTNPNAPPGPGYMPQYKPTGEAEAAALDRKADTHYAEGEKAAGNADDYIRTTVILASVLFLIGISSHFPLRGVRIGLISVGVALLVVAGVQILSLPAPP